MSASVIRQAEQAEDAVEAAKLRDKWSRKLLEDETLRQDHADNLSEAVDLLEERYPEIMGLAIGEADDFARRQRVGKPKGAAKKAKPSSSKRNTKSAAAQKKGGASKGQGSKGKAAGLKGKAAGLKEKVGRRGKAASSPRARRAWRDTGIPGATEGATSSVLSILGLTVGASLAYLLLTNAESSAPGRSAIAHIAKGVSRAVESLILPVDPLRSAASARTTANTTAASPGLSAGPQAPTHRPKSPFPSERRPA